MENHNKAILLSKIAHLESKIDLLESELTYLDQILVECGFPEGIATLKMTVEELIAENPSQRKLGGELF
ncbi:MAG: hypothetical protein ACHQT8_06825 [Chlamydiales bacterium]